MTINGACCVISGRSQMTARLDNLSILRNNLVFRIMLTRGIERAQLNDVKGVITKKLSRGSELNLKFASTE